ncbi:putative ribonuclease H domain-containing protein [Arabidopsis thaliana]
MQHLWSQGYTRVIFEGDCKILVDVLRGKTLRFDIANWLQDILSWKRRFKEVKFSWIPRQGNQPADKLVKSHRFNDQDFSFYYYVPICISNLLHSDYGGSN